jgi:hypothetical protein
MHLPVNASALQCTARPAVHPPAPSKQMIALAKPKYLGDVFDSVTLRRPAGSAGAGGDDLWTHLWQYARVFLALLLADFLLLTVRDTCSCTLWAVSLSYVPPFCSCPAYLPHSCLLASSCTRAPPSFAEPCPPSPSWQTAHRIGFEGTPAPKWCAHLRGSVKVLPLFPSLPCLALLRCWVVLMPHQVSNMLRQDLTYLSTHSGSTKGRIDVESDRLNAVASEAPVAVMGALVQVVGGLAWVASSK